MCRLSARYPLMTLPTLTGPTIVDQKNLSYTSPCNGQKVPYRSTFAFFCNIGYATRLWRWGTFCGQSSVQWNRIEHFSARCKLGMNTNVQIGEELLKGHFGTRVWYFGHWNIFIVLIRTEQKWYKFKKQNGITKWNKYRTENNDSL